MVAVVAVVRLVLVAMMSVVDEPLLVEVAVVELVVAVAVVLVLVAVAGMRACVIRSQLEQWSWSQWSLLLLLL